MNIFPIQVVSMTILSKVQLLCQIGFFKHSLKRIFVRKWSIFPEPATLLVINVQTRRTRESVGHKTIHEYCDVYKFAPQHMIKHICIVELESKATLRKIMFLLMGLA